MKRNKRMVIVILAATVALLAQDVSADTERLKKLWEAAGFMNPESVVFDPGEGVLYVSNVNGDPGAKDGNGFISKLAMDGRVLALEWLKGLDAPKGLAVYKGKLFVADIDTLLEIDMKTAAVSNRYRNATAKFMNDVDAAPDGTVYVSDTPNNRIYRLQKGKLEIWLEDKQLDAPNGLHVEAKRLMVGTMGDFQTKRLGQLLAVSLADKSISSASGGNGLGVIDGVEVDLDGDYYVTDWPAGKILHVESDGSFETLLEIKMGTADLEFIQAKDTMVIPLMMDNKVEAYKAHAYEE